MPLAKASLVREDRITANAAVDTDAGQRSSEHRQLSWCQPDWPAPANIGAGFSTRYGGYSHGPFAGLNVGDHVGDDASHVAANRQRIADWIAADVAAHHGAHVVNAPEAKSDATKPHIAAPQYLQQVHGTVCVELPLPTAHEQAKVSKHVASQDSDNQSSDKQSSAPPRADAAFSCAIATPCLVMTADCLPVLFCDQQGTMVAAAHAGWRGLCDGVLEQTVAQFDAKGVARSAVMVWLGPAIGPMAFEVGSEVRQAFMAQDADAVLAFQPQAAAPDKWLADLYLLARQRLNAMGISAIYGGHFCTYTDAERFFSYRRDGQTGRMVSAIWRRN